MNQIAKVSPDREDVLRVMQQALYPGARRESVEMVLGYCQARGLDPMLKPVHIVPMYVDGGMRDVPLPGIALYRIQAARSGEYNGKTEPEFGPDVTRTFNGTDKGGRPISKTVTYPAWCRVTVRRGNADFAAKEFWAENYATMRRDSEVPNDMWAKRPYGQLAKCAEAQALRMAFPELTGGEPTSEEMEGKTFAPEAPPIPPARGPVVDAAPAPAEPVLTLIKPDGSPWEAPSVAHWERAALRAVGLLAADGPDALRAWLAVMEEHITAAGEAGQRVRDEAAERLAVMGEGEGGAA